jgi:hypothetical protein
MTTAVCFKCGAFKVGAFCDCQSCGAWPQTEDQLALSLAMTDNYFDIPTLERMATDIRGGEPVHLDPQSREQLVQQVRSSGILEQMRKRSTRQSKIVDPVSEGDCPK